MEVLALPVSTAATPGSVQLLAMAGAMAGATAAWVDVRPAFTAAFLGARPAFTVALRGGARPAFTMELAADVLDAVDLPERIATLAV